MITSPAGETTLNTDTTSGTEISQILPETSHVAPTFLPNDLSDLTHGRWSASELATELLADTASESDKAATSGSPFGSRPQRRQPDDDRNRQERQLSSDVEEARRVHGKKDDRSDRETVC